MRTAKNKTALYPGSFDPVTNGHIDILQRACRIFDSVIMAVSVNGGKNSLLSPEEKVMLIKKSCLDIKNVYADSFDGLTAEYAKKHNACVIIRGLRSAGDFEYEMHMASANSMLCPDIQTMFLITKPEYNFISSSTVKEIAKLGGDISGFVPEPVSEYLKKKFMKGGKND